MMSKGGYTYIVTNKRYGVLYTGMTAVITRRIFQHREGNGSAFAGQYNAKMLVWYEWHDEIENAIIREKRIKAWNRMWKIRIIEEMNPSWDDLFLGLNG
jgi:putative endonuclease